MMAFWSGHMASLRIISTPPGVCERELLSRDKRELVRSQATKTHRMRPICSILNLQTVLIAF